jgi:YVTN family beta-propeller protein
MLDWPPIRSAAAKEPPPLMIRSSLLLLFVLSTWSASARAGEPYVTNTRSGTISVVDTVRDEVVATIALGGGVPNRVVLTPDGAQAWAIPTRAG